MSHEGLIKVTFGKHVQKFKRETSPGQVLNHMAKMFPPRGALLHRDEEGLVVLSQEAQLSQENYTYEHPRNPPSFEGLDQTLLNAVLRLELVKKGVLEIIGTAVVYSKEGLCLTTEHCLENLPTRSARNLRVGGHRVNILARDKTKDIACLQITDGDGEHEFIPLAFRIPIVQKMDVHLMSYPCMIDDEFETVVAIVTHGQVVNQWDAFLFGGDYACFPNSSGGAIVHANKLIGIHVENIFSEEDVIEEEDSDEMDKNISDRLDRLEKNQIHKSSLGNFIHAGAIASFLTEHKLMNVSRFTPSSSTASQGRASIVSNRRRRFQEMREECL